MNKKLFLMLLCLLVGFTNVFAAVAIYENGTYKGEATAIDIAAGKGVSTFTNGERANLPITTNILGAGMYNGSTGTSSTSETTITASYTMVKVYLTTRTLTLGNGTVGQIMTFVADDSDAGDVTLTASTKTGWKSATIADCFDSVTLLYVDDTIGWVVIGSANLTVNQ